MFNELGGEERVLIEVYAPKMIFSDDRRFLTNYASLSIGHPFDRETYLSCNILFSDRNKLEIEKNYEQQIHLLELIKKDISNTPKQIGIIPTFFTTNSKEKNRLLF